MSFVVRHLSAGAIVIEANQILLVQSRSGHWGLPKGHWELGESLAAAAGREVLEETGLIVEIKDLAFVTEFHSDTGREHRVQFYFAANPLTGTLRPRVGETIAVRWVPLDEIDRFIRWLPWLEPLRQWLDGKAVRYHRFPDPSVYRLHREG